MSCFSQYCIISLMSSFSSRSSYNCLSRNGCPITLPLYIIIGSFIFKTSTYSFTNCSGRPVAIQNLIPLSLNAWIAWRFSCDTSKLLFSNVPSISLTTILIILLTSLNSKSQDNSSSWDFTIICSYLLFWFSHCSEISVFVSSVL